jgi:outer membrane lipoprotein-sorting protein
MKTIISKTISVFVLMGTVIVSATAQNATEIVKRADDKMRGEKSGYSEMSMKIVRPSWNRTITFKSWSKGTENSLVYIQTPVKEQGQTFLKLDREMWNWNPRISRMIKLPTSMLSQGWMGSDFTNDDLLNQRSIVVDYTHTIVAEETVSNELCYKIELIPKENAPVVWGKIYMWISKQHDISMKVEYFDEDDYLVKSEIAYELKEFDGRLLPARMEIIPADEEGNKTVVTIKKMEFNIPIEDSFFSQQNMKKVR